MMCRYVPMYSIASGGRDSEGGSADRFLHSISVPWPCIWKQTYFVVGAEQEEFAAEKWQWITCELWYTILEDHNEWESGLCDLISVWCFHVNVWTWSVREFKNSGWYGVSFSFQQILLQSLFFDDSSIASEELLITNNAERTRKQSTFEGWMEEWPECIEEE